MLPARRIKLLSISLIQENGSPAHPREYRVENWNPQSRCKVLVQWGQLTAQSRRKGKRRAFSLLALKTAFAPYISTHHFTPPAVFPHPLAPTQQRPSSYILINIMQPRLNTARYLNTHIHNIP